MARNKSEEVISNEYPKMLYKHGGEHEIQGGKFHIAIADDAEGEQEAIEQGWFLTTPEALQAFEAEQAALAAQPDPANAPAAKQGSKKAAAATVGTSGDAGGAWGQGAPAAKQ
jgi:hypothetical protein